MFIQQPSGLSGGFKATRQGWDADVALVDGTPLRMTVRIDEVRTGFSNTVIFGDVETAQVVARLTATGPDSC